VSRSISGHHSNIPRADAPAVACFRVVETVKSVAAIDNFCAAPR
jgi:hypothetical protein